MPDFRAALSGTAIEREHRAIDQALSRVAPVAFAWDLAALEPDLLALLRLTWRERMRVEHRSSAVFAQLAGQLMEANAFLDEQVVMLRMAQDELRHARTCADIVLALGGDPTIDADLAPAPLATHRGVSAEERALRNVIYTTCLSEMVACARFVATLDATTDPMMAAALRRLLSDEVLHGRFGFHYLAARADRLAAEPALRDGLARYLVHAFAVIEPELTPTPPFQRPSERARGYGVEDPALAHEVFYATITGAVIPGLEQHGIAAADAWRDRRRLA
ncbi:MAG: ferritin-like domain-containing protein [Myxococcota bacterium]